MTSRGRPKPRPSKPVSAKKLMATPAPILEWLRSKSPRSVVTKDICDASGCLVANFLASHKIAVDDETSNALACYGWFSPVLNALPGPSRRVTASKAIDTIVRVCKENKTHLRSLS